MKKIVVIGDVHGLRTYREERPQSIEEFLALLD